MGKWWKWISLSLPMSYTLHFLGFQPLYAEEISLITWVLRPLAPRPPGTSTSPSSRTFQAESPYSSSLSSSLLINQSHSMLSGPLGLFCYVFLPSLLCDSLLFFISLFLMRALLFLSDATWFILFIFLSPSLSFLKWHWKHLCFLITRIEMYWSIQSQMQACHHRTDTNEPLLNIITILSVWSHRKEIK